jgi:hypothetical protein
MRADWRVTWSDGRIEFFCNRCYAGLTNKHKIEDVSKCKDETKHCVKCEQQVQAQQ